VIYIVDQGINVSAESPTLNNSNQIFHLQNPSLKYANYQQEVFLGEILISKLDGIVPHASLTFAYYKPGTWELISTLNEILVDIKKSPSSRRNVILLGYLQVEDTTHHSKIQYILDQLESLRTLMVQGVNPSVSKSTCDEELNYFPNVIRVGGIDASNSVVGSSGDCADLFAPGSQIRTYNKQFYYDEVEGNFYAAAHVAGGMALYLNRLSVEETKVALRYGSTKFSVPGALSKHDNRILYLSSKGTMPECYNEHQELTPNEIHNLVLQLSNPAHRPFITDSWFRPTRLTPMQQITQQNFGKQKIRREDMIPKNSGNEVGRWLPLRFLLMHINQSLVRILSFY
jgi:subtilisin family serine protease